MRRRRRIRLKTFARRLFKPKRKVTRRRSPIVRNYRRFLGGKRRHRRYINSAEWARRREQFKQEHGRTCQACGASRNIEVHHVTYARAYSGNEPDRDLRVLCRTHHQMAHDYADTGHYNSLESATKAMMNDIHRRLSDDFGKAVGS